MKVVAKPIEMIAWFEDGGKINPIKFKMYEDNTCRVIKVDRVMKREKEKIAGSPMQVFTCASIINGIEKVFEVKYDINTCKWILFKI